MRKKLFFLLLLICIADSLPAKNSRKSSFCQVLIPKDIATQLDESYGKEFVNASANVCNLLNSKEKYLVNGVYAIKGQGPHFPRKIFIYRNKEIFFFQNIGAFNPDGVIKEFSIFLSKNKLTNNEIIMYLRAIYEYLKNENGMEYGSEIKKDK